MAEKFIKENDNKSDVATYHYSRKVYEAGG